MPSRFGLLNWLGQGKSYIFEVIKEARKVIWPTRRDVFVTSIMVFALSAVFAVFFFFVDQVVIKVVEFLLGVAGNV